MAILLPMLFSDNSVMILNERFVSSLKFSAPSTENKWGLLKKWSYDVKSFSLISEYNLPSSLPNLISTNSSKNCILSFLFGQML